jgi:hypothetical protein
MQSALCSRFSSLCRSMFLLKLRKALLSK